MFYHISFSIILSIFAYYSYRGKIARQTLHTGKACPAAVIFPLTEQD